MDVFIVLISRRRRGEKNLLRKGKRPVHLA